MQTVLAAAHLKALALQLKAAAAVHHALALHHQHRVNSLQQQTHMCERGSGKRGECREEANLTESAVTVSATPDTCV